MKHLENVILEDSYRFEITAGEAMKSIARFNSVHFNVANFYMGKPLAAITIRMLLNDRGYFAKKPPASFSKSL